MSRILFVFAVSLLLVAVIAEFDGACIGMGIAALAVFDLFLVQTVLLIAAPLILGNVFVGRTQAVATFFVSLCILLTAAAMLVLAVVLLFTMLGTLAFFPVYLAAYSG